MDFLEIFNQKVNLRHIQKLSDYVRGFNKTKGEDVLSDGPWIVIFRVEEITMQFGDLSQEWFLTVLIFSKAVGLVIERPLEESLYFEGVIFFSEGEDHPIVFLAADNKGNNLVIGENSFNFVEGLAVSHKLILGIDNLNIIFIKTFLVLLISFFKYNHNEIIISELFYHLFYSINIVYFDFLSWPVLVNMFVITFEADQNVAISHDLHKFYLVLNYSFPFGQIFKPEEILFVGIVEISLV